MSNREIQAAWHYHNGTKHPDGHLMDRWHSYDPMDNPLLFKIYSELEPIPLCLDTPPPTMTAIDAISISAGSSSNDQVPNFLSLSKILHLSAGITKRIDYPWGEMAFRAAACTGALYHIELYLVCGDLQGLKAGIYHFDAHASALKQLRKGDYREVLVEASDNQQAVANAPATIICTDVFWRNAVKYQAREYRHAFWDCGTILANTLAVSSACGIPTEVVLGFTDGSVNQLLELDTGREAAIALVPLGQNPGQTHPPPEVGPLSLQTLPISDQETDFPPILEMHKASALESKEEVASWRGPAPPITQPDPSGPISPLATHVSDRESQDSLESVILRRGSARRFRREPITFQQLSTILRCALEPVPLDFLGDSDAPLNDLYLIVTAVDGLASGLYVFHRDRKALEQLSEGDFRQQAGILGLQQNLPADASVNIYMMCGLGPVLERLGNRGYRAAQLEASITGGRIYLAAYAQRLGATGLTFYDDGVTEIFSPHAKDKSPMFLVAVGKRARQ